MKYIIAVGTLEDGWNFIGPYNTFEEADDHDDFSPWPTWICEVKTREESEKEI
jgi:hypothetical protein